MTMLREIDAVRNTVGIWTRDDHTMLQFQGADAAAWLQAQTTNDVVGLASGEGCINAMLDRQGRVQAFFSTHRFEDEYWLIIEKAQVAAIEARIGTHLFLEDVKLQDVGAGTPHILVEGPRALPFLCSLFDEPPEQVSRRFPKTPLGFAPLLIREYEVLVFQHTTSGEDGFLLVTGPGESEALYEALQERVLKWMGLTVGPAARESLRLEAGIPRWGLDIIAGCVISETPLEGGAVSYEKGCYLGQEVVARIKAYGSPKQALVGLRIPDDGSPIPEAGTVLSLDGKRAGRIASSAYSPTLECWLALAYLGREKRTPGMRHAFETQDRKKLLQAEVRALPFYRPATREERARRLYDEALKAFNNDPEDKDETPIALLKEAIVLAPDLVDAYEMLGVILHRRHRVDEAILYMKTLEALDPNSVMAHTNLSVFYVAKGMIREAEEEKAKAGQLEFKQKLDAREAQRAAASERERIQREAEERIAMFKEVLEIDPEDPVATMGLGTAYIQLERYAGAIPYLETATRAKKDYSAAYLNLGKCHEFLEHFDEARETYRAGIQAAGRKGDLMPMHEMERRLRSLTEEGSI